MSSARQRLWELVKTTLLGGLAALLPAVIVCYFLVWCYRAGSALIRPLSDMLIAESRMQDAVAGALVLAGILGFCFALGVLVRTRLGNWFHRQLETWLFSWIPGYKLIKETVGQFIGQGKASPFLGVCLCQPFASEVWMTALVTAEHEDGRLSVYVPNAPLPTTGVIYHLPAVSVRRLPGVSIEQAMRTIMACGAGSESLLGAADIANRH